MKSKKIATRAAARVIRPKSMPSAIADSATKMRIEKTRACGRTTRSTIGAYQTYPWRSVTCFKKPDIGPVKSTGWINLPPAPTKKTIPR